MEISLQNLRESVKPIIEKGIANAKSHGINLHPGVLNLANGDCALECMIDGINTRNCFEETYDGTPNDWRLKWFTEVEDLAFNFFDAGMSRDEWDKAWSVLKTSGAYEYVLGDLIIPSIAHCTRKDVLIFNTSPRAHSPIFVVEASTLGNRPANTDIPVIMAYDQSHYESLVPDTDDDILKTIALKKNYLEGKYERKNNDVPILREQIQEQNLTYAASVSRKSTQKISQQPNPKQVLKKKITEQTETDRENSKSKTKKANETAATRKSTQKISQQPTPKQVLKKKITEQTETDKENSKSGTKKANYPPPKKKKDNADENRFSCLSEKY